MFPILLSQHLADTKANIYKIFNGNWPVDVKYVNKELVQFANYFLECKPEDQSRSLIFELKKNNNTVKFMAKFNVSFSTNGNFIITQLPNKEEEDYEKIATMVDLCHNVDPHVSATGYWGNNEDLNFIYNLEVITKAKAQLTLYNQDNGDTSVYNFHKIVEKTSYWIYIRAFLIFLVFFTVQQQISKFVIKKETQRIEKKQRELRAQKKAQPSNKEAQKEK